MKITAVEVILEDRPGMLPPFVWRKNLPGSDGPSTGAWLAIETDAGTDSGMRFYRLVQP